MGKVVIERGDKAKMTLIYGADFEPIERYVDQQNDLVHEIRECEQVMEEVERGNTVPVGSTILSVFDHTRPLLLAFLAATKTELERQLRKMPLVVRIRSDEEEGKSDE